MRKTIEQMLEEVVSRNGFTPGSDIHSSLAHLTDNARKEMAKRGYVKKVGSGLVLTPKGYTV